jgi:hypothetical protein
VIRGWRLTTTMLDGDGYSTAFPHEGSETKVRLQSLFEKMAKLEEMLRRNIQELSAEPANEVTDFPASGSLAS